MAGFADGDAISGMAVEVRDVLRAWGWTSDIYAVPDHVSPSLRGQCRPLQEYRSEPGDLALHHYSIGSPALEAFASARARKILVYHNITPAAYFRGFDDRVAGQLEAARATLQELAPRVDACWAVSDFNARELRELGARQVQSFPLIFSTRQLDLPPERDVLGKFTVRLKTILFVGRVAPNKRVEDLIEAYFCYSKGFNPYSRLVIVGSERSCPRYFAMLRMMVGDLDLPNVCFEGFASPAGLPAYYQCADLFVTPSAHEGYCLPLLEAMYMGVPVVAREVGGVPEALQGAGVMYDGLDGRELAALMHRVMDDEPVRQSVLAAQRKRLEEVKRRDIAAELRSLLGAIT